MRQEWHLLGEWCSCLPCKLWHSLNLWVLQLGLAPCRLIGWNVEELLQQQKDSHKSGLWYHHVLQTLHSRTCSGLWSKIQSTATLVRYNMFEVSLGMWEESAPRCGFNMCRSMLQAQWPPLLPPQPLVVVLVHALLQGKIAEAVHVVKMPALHATHLCLEVALWFNGFQLSITDVAVAVTCVCQQLITDDIVAGRYWQSNIDHTIDIYRPFWHHKRTLA